MKKAAATRMMILEKAFELVYARGYQTTSVDDILATTGVTKGAFYYHFKNKDEMGIAMIRELMIAGAQEIYVQPLAQSAEPAKVIPALMKQLLFDTHMLQARYGCPAGNLTQEVAQLNEDFNAALNELNDIWQQGLENCLNNGKKAGNIRKAVNVKQVAAFIISGYWGIRTYARLHSNTDCYHSYLKELKNYLKSLA
jgi:TetR/AcrR family transcriptional regulator, transcriptional repressor for nem operon